jgi:hypothetical protein
MDLFCVSFERAKITDISATVEACEFILTSVSMVMGAASNFTEAASGNSVRKARCMIAIVAACYVL